MPLEPPREPIAGDGLADRLAPLVGFADSLGLEVSVESVPGAALGYHEPATGRIVVEDVGPGFSANAQVSVLVHELAHALVRIDRREDDPRLVSVSRVRENRTPGSMRRWEETRPVGPACAARPRRLPPTLP